MDGVPSAILFDGLSAVQMWIEIAVDRADGIRTLSDGWNTVSNSF